MAWTDEFGLDIDLVDAPRPQAEDRVPGAGLALAVGALLAMVIIAAATLVTPQSERAQLTSYALGPRPWPTADFERGPQRVAPASSVQQRTRPQRVAAVSPVRQRTEFAVSFGGFAHPEVAAIRARLVRSKGYIARVSPHRSGFRVLSRAYGGQEQAVFWSRIFDEIGVHGRVVALVNGTVPGGAQ